MTKNVPFQQHQIPKPKGMNSRWFRRHIVLDHINLCIYIQIMWDALGELNLNEYYNITKGAWHEYVPKEHIDEYRQAVQSGYKVRPIVVAGDHMEEHVIMQLINMEDKRHVVNDSTLKPLGDN